MSGAGRGGRWRGGVGLGLGLGLGFACVAACVAACVPETCDEDPRAQVLETRVTVTIGAQILEAELADDPTTRARGWMHRRCDREALLLDFEPAGGEASDDRAIWGCALTAAIDAYWIDGGEVVAHAEVEPCPEPCGACPRFGAGRTATAILEVPAGALAEVATGAPFVREAP